MSGKIRVALAAMLICLLAVLPALAAGVFQFADKSVSLREGEIFQTALRREGVYDGDGEITFTSSKPGIASVSGDGTITAVTRGEAVVYANLMRNGKRVGRAQMSVKVIRPVTKVTLSTNGLAVYEPDDPTIAGLLREATEYRVIAVAAGATVNLSAVCTPTDAYPGLPGSEHPGNLPGAGDPAGEGCRDPDGDDRRGERRDTSADGGMRAR